MDRHEYENLNIEDQAKVFSKAPLKERGDLILSSHEPAKLTQGLSPEELYLVTKEIPMEERGDIICFSTMTQLTFLADIDCWQHDQMDRPASMGDDMKTKFFQNFSGGFWHIRSCSSLCR